jgi:hypothetical protein
MHGKRLCEDCANRTAPGADYRSDMGNFNAIAYTDFTS